MTDRVGGYTGGLPAASVKPPEKIPSGALMRVLPVWAEAASRNSRTGVERTAVTIICPCTTGEPDG